MRVHIHHKVGVLFFQHDFLKRCVAIVRLSFIHLEKPHARDVVHRQHGPGKATDRFHQGPARHPSFVGILIQMRRNALAKLTGAKKRRTLFIGIIRVQGRLAQPFKVVE